MTDIDVKSFVYGGNISHWINWAGLGLKLSKKNSSAKNDRATSSFLGRELLFPVTCVIICFLNITYLKSGEIFEVPETESNGNSVTVRGMVLADYPLVLVEREHIQISK